MSAQSSNREKHGEIGSTVNLSIPLVLPFFGFSKRLAQGFAAETTSLVNSENSAFKKYSTFWV